MQQRKLQKKKGLVPSLIEMIGEKKHLRLQKVMAWWVKAL